MYQSYLRRDLEKRIRKDRKMYLLPLGIAVTVGLVLSISTLLKSINGTTTSNTQGGNCNRTFSAALINVCDASAEDKLANLTYDKVGTGRLENLKCCVKEYWKKCMDEAMSKSGCRESDGVLVNMIAKMVQFHWGRINCRHSCDPEKSRHMLLNLKNLTTSRVDKTNESGGGIRRKPKKWDGVNWNDEIVTDNDTSEVEDDSVENDVNQFVFKDIVNMTGNDSDEDDSVEDESSTTTLTALTTVITSTLPTTEIYPKSNDTIVNAGLVLNGTKAISHGSSIDEIDILVEEEEDNVQEEDTISNETDIDTSDFIKSVRVMRALVNNNSAYLIEVNLLLAFINIFCYALFVLVE